MRRAVTRRTWFSFYMKIRRVCDDKCTTRKRRVCIAMWWEVTSTTRQASTILNSPSHTSHSVPQKPHLHRRGRVTPRTTALNMFLAARTCPTACQSARNLYSTGSKRDTPQRRFPSSKAKKKLKSTMFAPLLQLMKRKEKL